MASQHPTLKVTYFKAPGKAFPVRAMLTIAGIPFQDEFLDYPTWSQVSSYRQRFPLGFMPTLTVDGTVFSESSAIFRYVADISGFAGANALEQLHIDQAVAIIEETMTGEDGLVSTMRQDPANFQASRERFVVNLRFHLQVLSDLLQRRGSGFFSTKLSVADFFITNVFLFVSSGRFDHVPATLFDEFPLVKAVAQRVVAMPGVQQALAAYQP